MSNELRNGSETAFPQPSVLTGDGSLHYGTPGLTKRELFAAMAMQGMVAHFGTCGEHDTQESAKRAVMCADALLAALRKTP